VLWPPRAAQAAPLSLEVTPTLGLNVQGTAVDHTVLLSNASSTPRRGTLVLTEGQADSSSRDRPEVLAHYAIEPGGKLTLQLPVLQAEGGGEARLVRLLDESGHPVVPPLELGTAATEPTSVVDLTRPSRIAQVLREHFIYDVSARQNQRLAVSSPNQDPASGEALLPLQPEAWGRILVVHVESETLLTMSQPQWLALTTWVHLGGQLWLEVTRPEHLANPRLALLFGGPAHVVAATDEMKARRSFAVVNDPAMTRSALSAEVQSLAPTPETRGKLVSYEGGNLSAAPWGAGCSYGLGAVQVLGFDTRHEELLKDPWTALTLTDLVQLAADQRERRWPSRLSPTYSRSELERTLNPIRSSKWPIIAAAGLLLLYSLIAGPVLYARARRRGRPLSVLWQLPLVSGVVCLLVLGIGALGRGLGGKATRLTLVEVAAGTQRGAMTRFRGFALPDPVSLRVTAHSATAIPVMDGNTYGAYQLTATRGGLSLGNLVAAPWSTLVIRERDSYELSGAVSIFRDVEGALVVRNGLTQRLRGVVLFVPDAPGGNSFVYFDHLDPGQEARSSYGNTVLIPRGKVYGSLDLGDATSSLTTVDSTLPEEWSALTRRFSEANREWWAPDVPNLLALVEGADSDRTDSGLPLVHTHTLLRVLGWGKTP